MRATKAQAPTLRCVRVAKFLRGLGRLLIWVGAIILAFVAYQLWGTNIAEARAQEDLEDSFSELLSETTTTTTATTTTGTSTPPTATGVTTTTSTPTTTTTTTTTTPPDDGDAVARIVIPAIGVDKIVVEGVSREDLRKGPGHYPGTPMPGQSGNAVIAGHRTTYGAPFHRVDELRSGDEMLLTTVQGSFTYRVTGTDVVSPTDVEVVHDQGDDRLTLTSCHPKYSARQRIVVSARLVDEPAPRPAPTESDGGDGGGDDGDPVVAEADTPTSPVESDDPEILDGGDRGPAGPALVWGAVAAAVWLLFFALSRWWRRWPAYVLGAPVFVVALVVFFEAVGRTLPANF